MTEQRFQPGDRVRIISGGRNGTFAGRIAIVDQWLPHSERWAVWITGMPIDDSPSAENASRPTRWTFRRASLETVGDAAIPTSNDLGAVIQAINRETSKAFSEIWAIQDAVVLLLNAPDARVSAERLVPLLQAIGRIADSVDDWVNDEAHRAGHGYVNPRFLRRLETEEQTEQKKEAA